MGAPSDDSLEGKTPGELMWMLVEVVCFTAGVLTCIGLLVAAALGLVEWRPFRAALTATGGIVIAILTRWWYRDRFDSIRQLHGRHGMPDVRARGYVNAITALGLAAWAFMWYLTGRQIF